MLAAETVLILGLTAIIGLAIIAGFAAWGWASWLRLRRDELGLAGNRAPAIGQRIDLADLKERIRKLEAIAAGVEI